MTAMVIGMGRSSSGEIFSTSSLRITGYMTWGTKLFASLCLYLCLLSVSGGAVAQLSNLTSAQQNMLQNLTSEQRDEILQQVRERSDNQTDSDKSDNSKDTRRADPQEVRERYIEVSSIERRLQRRLTTERDDVERPRVGIQQELDQFGYDLFSGENKLPQSAHIPVPSQYTIGPGDVLEVVFYGKRSGRHQLDVNGEGKIHFPELGPMNVAGKSFAEVRGLIDAKVDENFVGVRVSVGMGELRAMQIFVTGDVFDPGSYTVSSLATLSNALLSSGGVKRIGSLRNIQLKRGGKVYTEFDLYDLLLNGDISDDVRLQDGDVVHVPSIGPTVAIGGEVTRPAIYELKEDMTVGRLVEMAGGTTPAADPEDVEISRMTDDGVKTIARVNIDRQDQLNKKLKDGDVVRVYEAPEMAQSIVTLRGHVRRPGTKEWHPGMRLTDVIGSVERDLMPQPDLNYAIIAREIGSRREVKPIRVNLGKAINDPDSAHNIELQERDKIFVFGASRDAERAELVAPLVKRLRFQARHDNPAKVVTVKGNVRFPGDYPWYKGMQVSDLIEASLDVRSGTDMEYALVARPATKAGAKSTRSVRLGKLLKDSGHEENIQLRPEDRLLVFTDQTVGEDSEDSEDGKDKEDKESSEERESGRTSAEIDFEESSNTDISSREITALAAREGISEQQAARRIANEQGAGADRYAHITRQRVERLAREEGISRSKAAEMLIAEADEEAKKEQQERQESNKEADEREEDIAKRKSRRELIDPLIDELRSYARHGHEAPIATISGNVRVQGEYPLEANMRVSDLIRAANGLEESAYALRGELTRYRIVDGKSRQVGHQDINLKAALQGDESADILLEPYDRLHIKQIPGWNHQDEIQISGEVRFPGSYSVRPGEELTELIERAGGLTERAYPHGAVFTREHLREREEQRMQRMEQRLQRDIATIRLREGDSIEGFQQLQDLLTGISQADAIGRLSIDLPGILAGQAEDIRLQDGDRLHIPLEPQEVTVIGEVQQPTSHLHRSGMTREDYIYLSGGTTRLADASRAFVVHANGEVSGYGSTRWFSRASSVQPGDTIVVPFDPDRTTAMKVATDVSQIFYQLGVSVAAWNSVGAF